MTRRIAVLLGALVVIAGVAPWLAPYNPETQHRSFLYAPPMRPHLIDDGGLRAPFVYSIEMTDQLSQRYAEDRNRQRPLPWFEAGDADPVFLLGADSYGRDLLSRLLHGARLSLSLALVSALGALFIGAAIGGFAGYRGGWADEAAMRAVDFVIVLPVIYVALVLRAMLPLALAPSTVFLMMAGIFALVGWPFVARGVRGIVAAEREREYVVAARSLGAGTGRIVVRHLLPACTGYLLVQSTLLLPAFILGEATLSYVGLGFPEHVATWGTMLIGAANPNAMQRFPWTLAPAVAIFLVVLVANVVLQSDKIASNTLRRI
ncbi:MAG TPA: ABC transporter permease [Vicinamibacterales bacterium]|nr:ABC transporter permease [Vicinamibacterales bacterium]